jgi:ABC-2 type transport system ATP-binding protein
MIRRQIRPEVKAAMSMIETINLTKKYGELVALNNLNLTINDGDCFGFIGPNGAGKTTTIKILATLLKPTWGEARIDGKVIGYQNPQIRPIIGYVPDFMGAYEDMVVNEYLEFFAACYDIHGKQRDQVVRDVLELTDLSYKSNAEVNGLSRGMKQRLSIARVLLHDPKVLLLDEPASGLDPRARIEIRELLKELRRMGKTIIISSHILHELAELCNTVGIIEQGELVFSGPVSEIMAKASMGVVVHIIVADRFDQAAELLSKVKGITHVDVTQHNGRPRIDVTIDPESGLPVSELPSRLIAQGFQLESMSQEQVNLETAFMRLTKGIVS